MRNGNKVIKIMPNDINEKSFDDNLEKWIKISERIR
jgi:hypothetical protein